MSDYFLAPALGGLRAEVDARFPKRDKSSDGWIGDPSHAARESDHNPDWGDPKPYTGIVRALDIDVDDRDSSADLRRMLLNACIGDPRVWYVISNGVIYSATFGWAARKYTGSNGHFAHVHVSLRHRVGEFNTARWFEPELPRIRLVPVNLRTVRGAFLAAAEGRTPRFDNGVGRIQRSLNDRLDLKLVPDGVVGAATLNAWRKWEETLPRTVGRPRVPDSKTLPPLARGRFRIT